MLPEGLPQYTLGWQILKWGSENLVMPDRDIKGEQWVYTNEQARFILWFYAIDDTGRYIYRRALLGRPKGWGKSPFVAALSATELLGPVVFSHWGQHGPVGKPHPNPRIQLAAISESQSENTLEPLREMLAFGPAASNYPLDILLSRIDRLGFHKGTIERVTASFRSREGNRPTFVVLDETHLWVPAERGPELAATLRRGLAKTGGRSIETTNAPVPGEGSVAEDSYTYIEQIEGGLALDASFLFDSVEVVVPDIYDHKQAMAGLTTGYGDAVWIDKARLWSEINDPGTKEYDARRFYFNQRVQGYSQWIKEAQWKKCQRELNLKPKRDKLALGFIGATRNGAAALVACRLTDMALFTVGLWEKPKGAPKDWEVPYLEVDARARKWLAKDNVYYLLANPWQWQDIVGRWSVDHDTKVEEFWMNQPLKVSKAVDQFEEALFAERIVHSGDPNLTRHVMNAHTEETTSGHVIRKETPHSERYISLAQAAVLALESAQIAIEAGALNETDINVYSF